MNKLSRSVLLIKMTSGLAVVRQQQNITDKMILKVIITWYDCSVGLHILHGQLEYLLVLMDGAERRLGGQGGEVSPGGGHCHEQCHELITGVTLRYNRDWALIAQD